MRRLPVYMQVRRYMVQRRLKMKILRDKQFNEIVSKSFEAGLETGKIIHRNGYVVNDSDYWQKKIMKVE